jgi:hypothetical protein
VLLQGAVRTLSGRRIGLVHNGAATRRHLSFFPIAGQTNTSTAQASPARSKYLPEF